MLCYSMNQDTQQGMWCIQQRQNNTEKGEMPPVLLLVSLAQRPASADLNLDLRLWQGL